MSDLNTDQDIAIQLFYSALRIRLVEETIAARYSESRMRCPTHLCTGQEGVSAAAGLALRPTDLVVSTHRSHGHYLGKGGNLRGMLAEIYGKKTGCSKGKGGSMHLIDETVGFMGSTAIVGGTIPLAVGLAYSFYLKGTDQVSATFLGDGSVEEGVFYESVNFAVLKKLPVLFICENNFYSVYSPLSVRQPEGRKIHEMVAAMGIKTVTGDGNDILETYSKLAQAISDARKGGGPVFLEFNAYRWREHCGANFDNHIGYRTQTEYEYWRGLEPVAQLKLKLLNTGVLTSKQIEEMEAKINGEIDEAFQFAENSPFPNAEEATQDLYRETPLS